jgi:hypothetical protein
MESPRRSPRLAVKQQEINKKIASHMHHGSASKVCTSRLKKEMELFDSAVSEFKNVVHNDEFSVTVTLLNDKKYTITRNYNFWEPPTIYDHESETFVTAPCGNKQFSPAYSSLVWTLMVLI